MRKFDTHDIKNKLPRQRGWLLLAAGAVVMLAVIGVVDMVKRNPEPKPPKPEPPGLSIRWLPQTVKRWEKPIAEMAQKYDLDPNLLAIIITLESGGYSKAKSEADARGLMQVTPTTARDISKKHLKQPLGKYDLANPQTNIEFGAAYLAYLLGEFGEPQKPPRDTDVELMAAGYNGGPGAAGRLYRGEGLISSETVSYSRDAQNMWRERHAKESPTFNRWLERGGQRLIDKAKAESKANKN